MCATQTCSSGTLFGAKTYNFSLFDSALGSANVFFENGGWFTYNWKSVKEYSSTGCSTGTQLERHLRKQRSIQVGRSWGPLRGTHGYSPEYSWVLTGYLPRSCRSAPSPRRTSSSASARSSCSRSSRASSLAAAARAHAGNPYPCVEIPYAYPGNPYPYLGNPYPCVALKSGPCPRNAVP